MSESLIKLEKTLEELQEYISGQLQTPCDFASIKALCCELKNLVCQAFNQGKGMPAEEILFCMDSVRFTLRDDRPGKGPHRLAYILESEAKKYNEQMEEDRKNKKITAEKKALIMGVLGFKLESLSDSIEGERWVNKQGKILPSDFSPESDIEDAFILSEMIGLLGKDVLNFYSQKIVESLGSDKRVEIFKILHALPEKRFEAAYQLAVEINKQGIKHGHK